MKPIKIAVASGKGGTGKTMIATSLAACLSIDHAVQFLDCDVEGPNGHLFLKPNISGTYPSTLLIPEVDPELCDACGKCVEVCQYHALALLQKQILVFPQLCHGCGSCTLNCPPGAIHEIPREIGRISQGETASGILFYMGELITSEPMPTPIIHQLKALAGEPEEISILDSPPGASCAVVATIFNADYVLLVTEPTPFGLHDLRQMLGVLQKIGTPAGVILNRDGIGDKSVETFLSETTYPILMKIPFQSEIASGLAAGQIMSDILPEYQEKFINLYKTIKESVQPRLGEG